MSNLEEPQCESRFARSRRPRRRGRVRAILILSLEMLAITSFVTRDVWLATMLQLLVLLVVYLDALDRRLPGALERPDRPRCSPVDFQ